MNKEDIEKIEKGLKEYLILCLYNQYKYAKARTDAFTELLKRGVSKDE